MKDNWLNDLDKKVQNAQEQAPEHLWDSISDRLFNEDAGKIVPLHPNLQQEAKSKTKRGVATVFIWATSAIAAAVLMFLYMSPLFDSSEQSLTGPSLSQEPPTIAAPKEERGLALDNPYAGAITSDSTGPQSVFDERLATAYALSATEERLSLGSLPSMTKRVMLDDKVIIRDFGVKPLPDVLPERLFIPTHRDDSGDLLSMRKDGRHQLAMDNSYADKARLTPDQLMKDKWSIMAYSNRMPVSSGQKVDGYARMSGDPVDVEGYPLEEKNGELISNIIEANAAQEVATDIQHRRPVSVGLALQYRVNKKMSLNVGLTYAETASTLASGSSANKIIQSQKINYIGLPLQVNYKMWNKKRVSAYVTGGATVEKSTNGRVTNEFILGDNVREIEKEPISASPFQFSLNSGVGVEAQLTRNVGLYIEPGIRYNIGNSSTVQTIYNQKPVNFNLNIGLRIPLP
ncbi:MAG: PorT family protein [Sphingobacterium sp.]|jgi:hypothetical protein|nr:PorT family protein [Sphingobacterium sp.]